MLNPILILTLLLSTLNAVASETAKTEPASFSAQMSVGSKQWIANLCKELLPSGELKLIPFDDAKQRDGGCPRRRDYDSAEAAYARLARTSSNEITVDPKRFDDCTLEQVEEITDAEEIALKKLSIWQQKLNEPKNIQSPGVSRAQEVVTCTSKILQSQRLNFKCNANIPSGVEAMTLPFVGSRIWLKNTGRYNMAAVLIHEATHKCGTTDAAFFRNGSSPRSVGATSWADIADTYQYWSNFSFFIPSEGEYGASYDFIVVGRLVLGTANPVGIRSLVTI